MVWTPQKLPHGLQVGKNEISVSKYDSPKTCLICNPSKRKGIFQQAGCWWVIAVEPVQGHEGSLCALLWRGIMKMSMTGHGGREGRVTWPAVADSGARWQVVDLSPVCAGRYQSDLNPVTSRSQLQTASDCAYI